MTHDDARASSAGSADAATVASYLAGDRSALATIWDRYGDTNNDGEYNMCDWYEPTGIMTFQEIEYQKQCSDG